MSKSKSLLSLFGLAAKNAAPEELDSMVETAAAALDAAPAVPAQDANPAKDTDPTDTQNTAVLDALNNLSGKLDQLSLPTPKRQRTKSRKTWTR